MIRYIIKRPVAVLMIVIALVVMGYLAIMRMPVSLLPDVDVPVITVHVNKKGASAREIDERLLRSLRTRLAQVSGLTELRSEARMDVGVLTLMFAPESNIDLILIEVNEKIDMAMGALPREIERPRVMKSSVSDIPAFFINMTLKNSDDKGKFSELSNLASNVVRRRIEQCPQVAMVDLSGTVGQKILLTPKYDKLHSMGLSVDYIEKALSDNNIRLGALSVIDGKYRYNIHFDSQLLELDDISNIRIIHEGRILSMDDISIIEQIDGIRNGWVCHDNKDAVVMAVIKQSDAKMSELKSSVEKTIEDLENNYPEIEFSLSRDQTQLLAFSFSNLENNLITGCFLTCLVLLFFLKNWRLSLLVALTIPLSLFITLLTFHLLGLSLNVISLAGLILGVGMIVDNAIIVADNIIQKRQRGFEIMDAVSKGTSEVFTPMLSSVLTTCSVFLPLIFLSGLAGELLFDMSMGISVSLFASLAVAILIVPVVYYRLHFKSSVSKEINRHIRKDWMTAWYERIFFYVMRHQKLMLLFAFISISGFLLLYNSVEKQRMPNLTYTEVQAVINWNEGISEEESCRRIKDMLAKLKDCVASTTAMTGVQNFVMSHTRNITSDEALIFLSCENEDKLVYAESVIQHYCDSVFKAATLKFEPIGNPFDIILNTAENDLELHIRNKRGARPEVADALKITDDIRQRFPEIIIPNIELEDNLLCKTDLEKMAYYGVSYSRVLARLRELTGENRQQEINNGEDAVAVVVGTQISSREQLMQSEIKNNEGVSIPLNFLMTDSLIKDYKRLYASVSGDYCPVFINDSEENIKKIIDYADSLNVAEGNHTFHLDGGYFSSRELVGELLYVLVVALVLLYLILAAQFESLVQPFIILSEMIINSFVVLMSLWLLDVSLNMMSMIGLIVMSGIVINDSILKIDTINRYRRKGYKLLRAVVVAGKERLRPIVMTSATTIFGVLPFLSKGEMAEDLQYPLSLTIVVGMLIGTAVSLFFVPMLYYIVYNNLNHNK